MKKEFVIGDIHHTVLNTIRLALITYLFTEQGQHSAKGKATFHKGSTNIILDHF